MEKNKKIILGIIIAVIGIIGVVGILGSNTSENSVQDDIVGQGNPLLSFNEGNYGKTYAQISQWFESKSGKEYKDVKIKIELYKNDKIISSKDTIISNLNDPEHITVLIDIDEEPDYAKTTVINATLVSK